MCLALFAVLKIIHWFVFFWQAARLTAAARHFKQKSLQTRVFGYPSASQLDLDSFVLFIHSADMKVCHLLKETTPACAFELLQSKIIRGDNCKMKNTQNLKTNTQF